MRTTWGHRESMQTAHRNALSPTPPKVWAPMTWRSGHITQCPQRPLRESNPEAVMLPLRHCAPLVISFLMSLIHQTTMKWQINGLTHRCNAYADSHILSFIVSSTTGRLQNRTCPMLEKQKYLPYITSKRGRPLKFLFPWRPKRLYCRLSSWLKRKPIILLTHSSSDDPPISAIKATWEWKKGYEQ